MGGNYTPKAKVEGIARDYARGDSPSAIATRYGVARYTVYRLIKRLGLSDETSEPAGKPSRDLTELEKRVTRLSYRFSLYGDKMSYDAWQKAEAQLKSAKAAARAKSDAL